VDRAALCGFRPLEEIAAFLQAVPELQAVVTEDVAATFAAVVHPASQRTLTERQAALRAVFAALMHADASTVAAAVAQLVARIGADPAGAQAALTPAVAELVVRLHGQFPGDVGCLCVFVLNYLRLQPGQALFLAARLPHAYLSGDCVECMATSDNVVRAGLTPKLRDVPTLLDLVAYEFGPPGAFLLNPTPLAPATPPSPTLSPNKNLPLALADVRPPPPASAFALAPARPTAFLYHPGVAEFQLVRVVLEAGEKSGWMAAVRGPSVLLVVAGAGTMVVEDQPSGRFTDALPLGAGDAYFIGPDVALALGADLAGAGLVVFRAFCPGPLPDQRDHVR
jgi:mannose-6-phosphate isomerase